MPIATPAQYAAMLDAAQEGEYAYAAINCSSLVTVNAALRGFAEKKSDGIIQFSIGAGQFSSGLSHKDAAYVRSQRAEIWSELVGRSRTYGVEAPVWHGLSHVAAVRLRTLTHDSLPKSGPGRAANGKVDYKRWTRHAADELGVDLPT